jgi:hypothetical protein
MFTINNTNTYITFPIQNVSYNFTEGHGSCKFCAIHKGDVVIPAESTSVICYGSASKIKMEESENAGKNKSGTNAEKNKEIIRDFSWKFCCQKHFDNISCKPQFCNMCNKKSIIRNNTPVLCQKCLTQIYDNCIEMNSICSFPEATCECKYCEIR